MSARTLANRLTKVAAVESSGQRTHALTWMPPARLRPPMKAGLTVREEKRQGHAKLWGSAAVRQSRKGGYREYCERTRRLGQPCPDPETQGLRREAGDNCGLWFFTHLQRSLGLSPTSHPTELSFFVPPSFVYDGKGWISPNPADTSSLCLARPSHLGKPRVASQNVPEG